MLKQAKATEVNFMMKCWNKSVSSRLNRHLCISSTEIIQKNNNQNHPESQLTAAHSTRNFKEENVVMWMRLLFLGMNNCCLMECQVDDPAGTYTSSLPSRGDWPHIFVGLAGYSASIFAMLNHELSSPPWVLWSMALQLALQFMLVCYQMSGLWTERQLVSLVLGYYTPHLRS